MKTKNISEFSYLIITKKNMEGELEFEPLLYEEEFKNFDQTLDQNLTRFNKVNEEVDKFEADNYINSNIENLDEALQSLIRSQANKDKISATLEKERTHIDDTIREIGDILSQRDSSSKMLAKANEDIMKKKRELSQHQNQTTSSRDLIEEKKGKLGLEMEKWKENLGLDLVLSTHGGIIFNFTNVKREDPQRRFMCEINGKVSLKFCLILIPIYFQLLTESTELRTATQRSRRLMPWLRFSIRQMTYLGSRSLSEGNSPRADI